MTQYTLTVVDTTGIQDYIFGTNQLKQNVGASYLVDCATRKWVAESLPRPNNVRDLGTANPFTDLTIEDDDLVAEVVYAGGGNTMIIFTGHAEGDAVSFARRLTRKVLLDAPGLEIVLAHQEFDWQGNVALGGKNGVVGCVMEKMALKKANHLASSPLIGLGVTAACTFTGLPAVGYDHKRSSRLISTEVEAKLKAEPQANDRLKQLFKFRCWEPAREFKDLGSTLGESSYIAVIHTDGNGIAKRIQGIRDKFDRPFQNRNYIQEMRSFSISLQQAAQESLQSTIDKLIQSIHCERGNKFIGRNNEIELQNKILPFRPIVFGGDDVTFICDGRLGLGLAAHYLQMFSNHLLSDGPDGKPAYCRGGIAVVKTHYPFSRAYALAEELCRSSKEYISKRQHTPYNEEGLTAMDWHFAVSGLARDLKDVRDREYTKNRLGDLLMRPVRLSDPEKDWQSWDRFLRIAREFQSDDGPWSGRHNKIKALQNALRAGPAGVEQFLKVNDISELPKIPERLDMAQKGWQGDRCGYFDAIEAMDFLVSLEGDCR
ncbi:hypothetical protein KO465_09940 [Candidatus Micrarchaeota archaeon]|jgi:hypothetical protein|nr:hypothetical protein [Candidatus Micrarchaeota archaeon]